MGPVVEESKMTNKKPVVAICYDFDGTLSPGNMQEYDLFPGLGITPLDFWAQAAALAQAHSADPILAYMKLLLDKARESGTVQITKKAFADYGRTVEFFAGVETWFDRINRLGSENGLAVEHYIISSGIKEIIEGTRIRKQFKAIYSCSFIYDQHGVALWPAVAVNYTTKTQFLFRINKGIKDPNDNEEINRYDPESERRVQFSRMNYLGDGDTDIPCMALVKNQGGSSIAVCDPMKRQKKAMTEGLLADGRVNFVAQADYTEDSHLDQIVKAALEKIAAEAKLAALLKKPAKPKAILAAGLDTTRRHS